MLSGAIAREIEGVPPQRIVLEITEHALVTAYDQLLGALAPLRAACVRLAVDDAGAGYSSLQHVVQLAPDIIELDIGLTRDIDTHKIRRALAAALAGFARETGIKMVAEGIETLGEMKTLERIGVDYVQGFLVGQPVSSQEISAQHQRNDS